MDDGKLLVAVPVLKGHVHLDGRMREHPSAGIALAFRDEFGLYPMGRHFCVGSRVAEMQVRILWEELIQRYSQVEVVGDPVRVRSSFVNGYQQLPVCLHAL